MIAKLSRLRASVFICFWLQNSYITDFFTFLFFWMVNRFKKPGFYFWTRRFDQTSTKGNGKEDGKIKHTYICLLVLLTTMHKHTPTHSYIQNTIHPPSHTHTPQQTNEKRASRFQKINQRALESNLIKFHLLCRPWHNQMQFVMCPSLVYFNNPFHTHTHAHADDGSA